MNYSNYVPVVEGWWIPSLPQNTSTTSHRFSEDPITIHESFTYSPETNTATLHPGTNAWSTKETTFNAHGNVLKTTMSGADVETIETDSYLYSSNGRFVEQHNNAFDQSVTYTYNHRWGSVKKAIDHLNRFKFYAYDNFGNLTQEVDHNDDYTDYTLEWASSLPTNGNCESLSDVLYLSSVEYPNTRFSRTHINKFGQVRINEWSGQFQDLQEITCYDVFGRVISKTTPHYALDAEVQTAIYEFDDLNRIDNKTFGLSEISYDYESISEGFSTTISSNNFGQTSKVSDLTGTPFLSTDVGGTLKYDYFSGGLLKNVKLDEVELVSNGYDAYGRQTTLVDKNAGVTSYIYDSYNRIIDQTDARDNNAHIIYDALGRKEEKQIQVGPVSVGLYDYEYYETGHSKHKLKKITAPSSNSTEYIYDENENITSIIESIDGVSYPTVFEYDTQGKPTRKIYPSGFAVRYHYDEKDYLNRIMSDDGQLVIWEILNANSQGNVLQYALGNGLVVNNVFHEQHNFLESVTATSDNESLFSFEYEFNPITANLMKRNLGVADEEFNYDEDGLVGLNRLTSSEIILSEENDIEEYTYSSNGNLESKTGVGEYVYDTNRLNAVDHIDQDGGMDEENANQIMLMQTVSYNHFNSVSELINVDNNLKVEFTYGPDDQRRKAEYFVGDIQQEWALEKTRYYVGSYEKQVDDVNNETEVHYISAGGMIVAMYVIENGIGQYYYPHQDHLGSIIHVTDENAEIVYTQSFDAWGRTRNADDLTYEDITERPNWLWRGYTGHEHLDEFGLINMNGRLYDPVIGRMLSPDNYVQSPEFSQSFNRYSYVWNNPLKYTDPSGEVIELYFLFFTKQGYKLQEFVSPIAFKINLNNGNTEAGIGWDASIGIPQGSGLGYRYHYGETKYKNALGDKSGKEIRKGGTWSVMLPIVGNVHFSGTTFSGMGEEPQTTHSISVDLIPGAPGWFGGTYENDTFLSEINGKLPGIPRGDTYSDQKRTAAAQINLFGLDVGIKLHTGSWDGEETDYVDGELTTYAIGGDIDDPNQSHGIFYIQVGNLAIGRDTENIRHIFQNKLAHDGFNGGYRGSEYPWIRTTPRSNRWYFQFGHGSGNSLF